MNREAERHLDKAESYLAKGELFYRKAADEIVAAKRADDKLTNRDIGTRLGHTESWVREVVKWAQGAESFPGTTPFGGRTAESKGRGAVEAKRVLAEAPLEQVEQIVAELPFERQQAIAAATGNRYAKARQDYDEKERRMTPAERKEREAATTDTAAFVARTMKGFDRFGMLNAFDLVISLLGEAIGNDLVDADLMAELDTRVARFLDEYRVAGQMVNMKVDA